MPLQDLEDAILARAEKEGSLRGRQPCHRVPYMRKQYNDNQTGSLSLTAIGDCLRGAGFVLATHRVISWYTTLDVAIFHRAILDHS